MSVVNSGAGQEHASSSSSTKRPASLHASSSVALASLAAAQPPSAILQGRYRLNDVIGKGAFAVVYEATDLTTGAAVAVKKMLATHHTGGDDAGSSITTRWRKEADMLRSVDHPNIVRYYDDFMDSATGVMYLVMEFAEAGSLLSVVRRKPLDEAAAAPYVAQVLSGLAYLHHRRILHRDVKAANVLLFGTDNVAKLTDFGLATTKEKTGQKNEHLSVLEGSVYWMAPEVIRDGLQSEAGDVWSVGCMTIEFITGTPPFFDRAPVNALYHIAESEDSPVPNETAHGVPLSAELRDFLRLCLQRDRTQRPRAVELLDHAWLRLHHVDVTPPPALLVAPADPDVGSVGAPPPGNADAPEVTNESHCPTAVTSADAMLCSEVEQALFADSADQREAWMENGGVRRALQAIGTFLTPESSYRVTRLLACFAKEKSVTESTNPSSSSSSSFFRYLGEVDLWALDILAVATPSDAAMLFCACCEHQDPFVAVYAPSHSSALRQLLPHADVGAACVQALSALLLRPVCTTEPVTSSVTAEAVPAGPLTAATAARSRFLRDGAPQVVRDVVQAACLTAFREKSEPALRWSTIDALFAVLLSFVDVNHRDTVHAMGDHWLLAVQEACVHRCPNAIRLLLRSSVTPEKIISGERVVVGRLVSIASDPSLDADMRLEIAQAFPLMQRNYPEAAAALCDVTASVPLLCHIFKYTSVGPPILSPTTAPGGLPTTTVGTSSNHKAGGVDRMLLALADLCAGSPAMAKACASYDGMFALALQKVQESRVPLNVEGLDLALKVVELLFASAPHPEWFVTSRQLTKLLVELIARREIVNSEWTVSQAIAHESAVKRASRLLNALAAQAVMI